MGLARKGECLHQLPHLKLYVLYHNTRHNSQFKPGFRKADDIVLEKQSRLIEAQQFNSYTSYISGEKYQTNQRSNHVCDTDISS